MTLILDLETAPITNAGDYLTPPDLTAIRAAANLKDPAKIAEDLEKRKAKAQDDYRADLEKCALDWNLNRIVVLGWLDVEAGTITTALGVDEEAEADALAAFFKALGPYPYQAVIGFYLRTFDLPTIIQRARLLAVKAPAMDLGRYTREHWLLDLYDVLTFNDARATSIMPRTLTAFCRRFGLAVPEDVSGADVPALIAAGEWQQVAAHCAADLNLTATLARRLGVL